MVAVVDKFVQLRFQCTTITLTCEVSKQTTRSGTTKPRSFYFKVIKVLVFTDWGVATPRKWQEVSCTVKVALD
jgi:hypothetical protein